MSMRLKVLSAIMGGFLVLLAGIGIYGYYSGKIGISADEAIKNLEKNVDLRYPPNEMDGVSVSIDDSVDQVKIGDKITLTVKVKADLPGTHEWFWLNSAQNPLHRFYIDLQFSTMQFLYTERLTFFKGETVYKFPYEITAIPDPSGDKLTFRVYLAGNFGGKEIQVVASDVDKVTQTTATTIPIKVFEDYNWQLTDANGTNNVFRTSPVAIQVNSNYQTYYLKDASNNIIYWKTLTTLNNYWLVYQFDKPLNAEATYSVYGKRAVGNDELLATFKTGGSSSNPLTYPIFDKSYSNIWPMGDEINLPTGLAIHYRTTNSSGKLQLFDSSGKEVKGNLFYDSSYKKLVLTLPPLKSNEKYKAVYKKNWWSKPDGQWFFTTIKY